MPRVPEKSISIPALQAAENSPNGTITTTQLIEEMTRRFTPTGRDADILTGRYDTYFSQKVRNLISHRHTKKSIFSLGYATYNETGHSITITQSGRDFLKKLPQDPDQIPEDS